MIFFRLDANSQVATGHLYRCLSIAKQCQRLGKECGFILSSDEYREFVIGSGFSCTALDLKWDDWDYGLEALKAFLAENHAECLLVDSYHVTASFFEGLGHVVPVFYLDDLCKEAYDVDAVLHYSEWDGDHYLEELYKEKDVSVFAGMKYMPLREAFHEIKPSKKEFDLLITTGGTDPHHVTLKLLESIGGKKALNDLSVCVILGRFNEDEEQIRELIARLKSNGREGQITIFRNVTNMKELMCASKLAITSGGTTVYELMACGVPFVCFGFSDDQKVFGERLSKHGNAFWGGDVRGKKEFVSDLMQAFEKLLALPAEEFQRMKDNNQRLVDGKGAERIAKLLISIINQ